jgi:hypothetical protein
MILSREGTQLKQVCPRFSFDYFSIEIGVRARFAFLRLEYDTRLFIELFLALLPLISTLALACAAEN